VWVVKTQKVTRTVREPFAEARVIRHTDNIYDNDSSQVVALRGFRTFEFVDLVCNSVVEKVAEIAAMNSIGAIRWIRALSACQRGLKNGLRPRSDSGSTISECLILRKSARRNWSSSARTGLPVSGLTTLPLNGPLFGAA
jgi:hypothetical protein